MTGQVTDNMAVLEVPVHLSGHPPLSIEFVIDTGFAGFLTMPPAAVAALKLPFFYKMPANLADDSNITVEVYTTTILWQGKERDVEILAMGKRPLIGRALLHGNETCIQFVEHGLVTITPL